MVVEEKIMTEKEKILLEKLRTLADKGFGGEKENAKAKLKKLLTKLGITEEMLEEKQIIKAQFKVPSNKELKMLFWQIVFKVLNKHHLSFEQIGSTAFVEMEPHQAVEIQTLYDFYKIKYKEDLDVFTHSFLMVNKLFPDAPNDKEKDEKFDFEKQLKMAKMMSGLDEHTYLKQLKNVEE